MKRRRRRLSRQDLKAAGATPGFMVRRVGLDGRARLEQLAPEGFDRKRDFIRRLTSTGEETKASEGSE
jgi:hypothetical protein